MAMSTRARTSEPATRSEAEILPSAVGLVWRALVLWLLLVFLLSLANWAPFKTAADRSQDP